MWYCWLTHLVLDTCGGGRVVRWCWVNFQRRGVLLIWIIVGQGPTALALGAGGGCLDIFYLVYHFSFLSPSLWETARYRLKYCLKGPLSPKQPTNQILDTWYCWLTHLVLNIGYCWLTHLVLDMCYCWLRHPGFGMRYFLLNTLS